MLWADVQATVGCNHLQLSAEQCAAVNSFWGSTHIPLQAIAQAAGQIGPGRHYMTLQTIAVYQQLTRPCMHQPVEQCICLANHQRHCKACRLHRSSSHSDESSCNLA